jgi:hypothetical protein
MIICTTLHMQFKHLSGALLQQIVLRGKSDYKAATVYRHGVL